MAFARRMSAAWTSGRSLSRRAAPVRSTSSRAVATSRMRALRARIRSPWTSPESRVRTTNPTSRSESMSFRSSTTSPVRPRCASEASSRSRGSEKRTSHRAVKSSSRTSTWSLEAKALRWAL